MTMEQQILDYLQRPGYKPVKPAALAQRLKIPKVKLSEFHAALDRLTEAGRIRETRKGVIRPVMGTDFLVGTIKRGGSGAGTFIPHETPPWLKQGTLRITARDMRGAHTGDEVLVRILSRRAARGQRCGRVEEILQRATTTFVGTYFESGGQAHVQIDGRAFQQPVPVGDPGAKGARPGDKVVIEMLRFPTSSLPGEAVITEVLGPRGEPGVDTISIIHEFGLPLEFPDDVLQEARDVAGEFDPENFSERRDLTKETIVTIDPADARDFDDAISLRRSRNGHWHLGVHIADVNHFVRPGSRLDEEARRRGNSVYLPDRVIPMLPELISNGLASLQQRKLRYTKSVQMEFTAEGIPVHAEFFNSVIRVTKRFSYDEVLPIIQNPGRFESSVSAKIRSLLARMRELAMTLRTRRRKAGALELDLPEVELELDADAQVAGAHETVHDESHQIIEEFMLAANMAVAQELADRGLPYMRRVHADPDEHKLRVFSQFVEALGFDLKRYQSRRDLQNLIDAVRGEPTEHAVNYALLRSLKQAEYSVADLGHYALAVDDYCHFTSPIRRYPDLTLHRLFEGIFEGKKRPPKTKSHEAQSVGFDEVALERLAKHCSLTERRADSAERELTQIKLLSYLSGRIGEEMEAVITAVESFGLFCRGLEFPAEGFIHISALDSTDFFDYDRAAMCLTGRRRGATFRLGDRIRVEIAHVDVDRRELDVRLVGTPGDSRSRGVKSPGSGGKRKGKGKGKGKGKEKGKGKNKAKGKTKRTKKGSAQDKSGGKGAKRKPRSRNKGNGGGKNNRGS